MNELSQYISTYFETKSEQSEKIAALFQEERIKRNDFHTSIGTRHGKLSLVKSGFLRIFKQTDKKEITQWISSPSEFATDLGCILFEQPARWNIQAITDCELYTLDYSNYLAIKEQIPNWSEIEKLFLAKCFMTIEDRIFSFISMSAEERYAYLSQTKPELLQQVPQQYIASMLGMTPETLSRIRKKIIS
ncbi:MAG: Crp/Fnr family transcriptional regulator [Crocinitomicaceae bacterium]|nr:Crp/Fnr family transcriptional regulator [Crocinitomicaceae bacterium]